MKILACDVSQMFLTGYDGELLPDTPNTAAKIRQLLLEHPGYIVVCEPTSTYHLELVSQAIELGHEVYLVNPKEARNFKDSISFRAKTDPLDARYLYEYVARNKDLLRAHVPLSPELVRLRKLLGERAQAVGSRASLGLSFGKKCSPEHEAVLRSLTALIKSLEAQMKQLLASFESYQRVRSIPGVGLIAGCALVFVLESKQFESADALVAFVGLDVRIRQSGRFKGQGKITKRGDSTLRYLLCLAGRALLNSKLGKSKRATLIARNRHFQERLVIGARKILRVAWHLWAAKQDFDPQKWRWA